MKTKYKADAKPTSAWSRNVGDAGVSQRLQDPKLAAPRAAAALPLEGPSRAVREQHPDPCAFDCCCTKCSCWQQEEERLQVRRVLGGAGEKGVFCEETVLSPEQHKGRGWPWFYAGCPSCCPAPRAAWAAAVLRLPRPAWLRVLLQAGRSPEQGQ